MAWLDIRPAQNAVGYRLIEFEGGRILQQAEVQALQSMQASKDLNEEGCIYREGALANAKVTVSGTTVTLSRANTYYPSMMVYFNGAWEPLPDTSLTWSTQDTGNIYLHWALWRVTADGTFNGQPGCLTDISLVDAITGEAVANRGQLQIALSTSASYSQEALDPVRQLAKSTAGVPLVQLGWVNNAPTASLLLNVNLYALANAQQAGFVRLTTNSTDGTAVADDDSRLTDQRVPTPYSVDNSKVTNLVPLAGQSTAINSPLYDVTGGISSAVIFYDTLRAKLSDILGWLYTNVMQLLGITSGQESRIAALENKTATPVDLGYHVGKPLSRSGVTHPPVSSDDRLNFEVNAVTEQGIGATTPYYAYAVNDMHGAKMGGVKMSGDYEITNQQLLVSIADAGLPGITTLAALMQYVGRFLKGTTGGSSGAPAPTTIAGDVTGSLSSSTVVKVQNTPVAANRSDGSSPSNGDVLTFTNGTLRPAAPVSGGGSIPTLQGDVTGAPTATALSHMQGKTLDLSTLSTGQVLSYDGTTIKGVPAAGNPTLTNPTSPITSTNPQPFNWQVLTLGSYQLAIGMGALRHGDIMPFPSSNWNKAYTTVTPSLSVIPRMNFNRLQLIPPNSSNGWQAQIMIDGAAPADPTSWWMYVSVITVSPV